MSLKPVFYLADISARSGAAVVFALLWSRLIAFLEVELTLNFPPGPKALANQVARELFTQSHYSNLSTLAPDF